MKDAARNVSRGAEGSTASVELRRSGSGSALEKVRGLQNATNGLGSGKAALNGSGGGGGGATFVFMVNKKTPSDSHAHLRIN